MNEEQREEMKDLEAGSNAPPVDRPEADELTADSSTPHPLEALLDEYPLRDPSEDPVWSVRIVRGWLYFLAFNFAWMLLFLVLGIFID